MFNTAVTLDFLLILDLGIILSFGVLGSFLLKKLGVPEILGFLLVGLLGNILLGGSLLSPGLHDLLNLIVAITLGFVGFHLGSELDWKTIRSMSLKVFVILFFEAVGTFILVTFIVFLITQQFALALIFGALSSATAPAGTAVVFFEVDAKGPLTATVMLLLALDDVISIILTDIAIDFASLYYTNASIDIISLFLPVVIDITASTLLGVSVGVIGSFLLNRVQDHAELIVLIVGSVLVCIGIADFFSLSLILPTMVFGVTIASLVHTPQPPHDLFNEVYRIASPLIAAFFVLIGLGLNLASLVEIGVLGLFYVIARTLAKTVGASAGSHITKSDPVVTKYIGPCLYSQAGVALGLAVVVSEHFTWLSTQITDAALANEVLLAGALVLNTITATTIIFQIFGPIAIRWAIIRSGEANGLKEKEKIDVAKTVTITEPITETITISGPITEDITGEVTTIISKPITGTLSEVETPNTIHISDTEVISPSDDTCPLDEDE